MATKTIIIATRELIGGTKSAREKLASGEELTGAKKKALGLTKADIDELTQRGDLLEVAARTSDEGGSGDIAAATKRAEDAEADLLKANERNSELEKENSSLKEQLDEATKPDSKSGS